jgi:hypothetical protein
MSRILITGMTASQMSVSANKRSLSFAGVMLNVLTSAGHEVHLVEPGIDWTEQDLASYDSVLVGVSPLTSLSANKCYGALHIIDLLWDDRRLVLFIDAPHPAQITSSLRAISANPNNLTKPFYSYRRGYQSVNTPEVSERLLGTVNRLLTGDWPVTLYPSLPWHNVELLEEELPEGALLNGVNLDSFLIEPAVENSNERYTRWVYETNKVVWMTKLAKVLSFPILPIRGHKGTDDEACLEEISKSYGVLLPQYKGGTWWTYRYAQAMNSGTPVATEWRESQAIGDAWAVLATAIETMSDEQRASLSTHQTAQYLASIPSRERAIRILEDLVLPVKVGKE